MIGVKLQLLGSFQVRVDGQVRTSVLAHSPKGIQLMQYLILNRGRMETTSALMKAMWPDSEAARPESALKTLISRFRTLLVQVSPALGACLKTVRGGYQWETQPGVSVDAEEFLSVAEELRGAIDITDEPQGRRFLRMMELYNGRLLYDQEQPEWMQQRADAYHRLYLDVVTECLIQLQNAGRRQEIVSVCREALDADPLNEELNIRLMDALVHTGRESEAIQQYHHAATLYRPTESGENALTEYYARMLQSGHDLERSLQTLRDELLESSNTPGALVCDRIVFGELFHMLQRSLARSSSIITLAVAMLSGLEHSPLQLDKAMHTLLEVMSRSLRRGDIITRMNTTQVAILLPHAAGTDSGVIADRLKRSFYLQYPTGCTLSFAFSQMEVGQQPGTR